MSEILEGMARAYEGAFFSPSADACTRAEAVKAALLWLADNVSDEMVRAFWDQFYSVRVDSPTNKAIAAALRTAAEGGE